MGTNFHLFIMLLAENARKIAEPMMTEFYCVPDIQSKMLNFWVELAAKRRHSRWADVKVHLTTCQMFLYSRLDDGEYFLKDILTLSLF